MTITDIILTELRRDIRNSEINGVDYARNIFQARILSDRGFRVRIRRRLPVQKEKAAVLSTACMRGRVLLYRTARDSHQYLVRRDLIRQRRYAGYFRMQFLFAVGEFRYAGPHRR